MEMKKVAIEDSIMVKGKLATSGSRVLEGFTSPIEATVVSRLRESGFAIFDGFKMAEFGLPRIIDGMEEEHSEAVMAVSSGAARWALCNDVFGINKRMSVSHGLFYIHPTYGTVSRFGLIPAAASMDQIGIVCRDPADGFGLLPLVAGSDPKDGAMFPETEYKFDSSGGSVTFALPGALAKRAGSGAYRTLLDFTGQSKTIGIDLPLFDHYKQVLCILAYAEISSNLTRYDGVKFGYRAQGCRGLTELYTRSRTEGFGLGAKLASVMGTMMLSQAFYTSHYEKAMRVRRMIKEQLKFDEYDVLLLPCGLGDDPYENLSLFALSPLAGLPSLTFQRGGQGIQLIAKPKGEAALLKALEVANI